MRIGPLSYDLVVACQIYEFQAIKEEEVPYSILAKSLNGLVVESKIPSLLRSLIDWGIVVTEFGETERLYHITHDALDMIGEVYDLCWNRVLKKRSKKT